MSTAPALPPTTLCGVRVLDLSRVLVENFKPAPTVTAPATPRRAWVA